MRTELLLRGALVVLALLPLSCKRTKPPKVARVWLGPTGGCAETTPERKIACWGNNDHGQLGDGTTTARSVATTLPFALGTVTDLALGESHACGVFDARVVACWGDGLATKSLSPVKLGDGEFTGQAVGVGQGHSCIRTSRDELSCFGADDSGQLGGAVTFPAPSKEWSRHAPIISFALGSAHTCVAYGPTDTDRSTVLCRGRSPAAPREPLLDGVAVKELAAGGDHTCALLANGTVTCWGKNDAGQLGDGTTNDAAVPTPVPELSGAVQVAAGRRHTCALLLNGTVACWGDNAHHQLAIGTTEKSSRPRIVVGIVGAKELSLGGDGGCVRLEGGYARCWGANDRNQLGDGTTDEHNVPMPMRFQ